MAEIPDVDDAVLHNRWVRGFYGNQYTREERRALKAWMREPPGTPRSKTPGFGPGEGGPLAHAHQRSRENCDLMRPGIACGCFHCLATFTADEVRHWMDDGTTAVCPHCGMDAVLSSMVCDIDPVFLRRMQERWFVNPPG